MILVKKIKKSKLWFYFLKIVFVPVFDFIWKNIINIHGRFLYIQWFKKERIF